MSRKRALIVDDDEAVRAVTQAMLGRLGYETIVAGSGAEALDLLAAQRADSPVDVVLLDLAMPNMSGADVHGLMRERGFDQPILFITGYSRDELDPMLSQGDATGVLAKPFQMSELDAAVRQMLA